MIIMNIVQINLTACGWNKMINNDTPIIAFAAAVLTACITLYFSHYHVEIMDSHPFKLKGNSVLVAAGIVAVTIAYFLKILWNERADLPHLFRPTRGRLWLCLIIALFTPVANLLWIPIPFAVPVVLVLVSGAFSIALAKSAVLFSLLVVVPAYGVACLSAVETPSFWRLVLPSLLYLVGCFAAVTLFTGITYI